MHGVARLTKSLYFKKVRFTLLRKYDASSQCASLFSKSVSLSILRLAYNETFQAPFRVSFYGLMSVSGSIIKDVLKTTLSKYFKSWFGRTSVAVWQSISIKLRGLSASGDSQQSTFINWDSNVDYASRKNLHNMTHFEKSCLIVSHISLQFHSSEEIIVLKSQSLRKYS